MRIFIILSIIIITIAPAKAQNYSTGDALGRLQQKEVEGRVLLEIDSLVLDNYHKHLVQGSRNPGVEGYRIRIFSDNGHGAKEGQKRVNANFLSLYPDLPPYPKYEGSYYKIYVGDFRTKRDALKVLEIIQKDFPDAFIVEDKINIKE